jgi:hypothetical protein
MKTAILQLVGAAFLCSSSALADPFQSCADAENYGYNTVRNLVSASYNKVRCNRNLASGYEGFLVSIAPTYLAEMARLTTAEKGACMLRGSNSGWLESTEAEYSECAAKPGFEAIQRRLLGQITGSLFQSFYWIAPDHYSPDSIQKYFVYPDSELNVVGLVSECESEIRVSLSGVPQELVTALIDTACR